MASMQVEINTTRAIAAQVLRHRSFSFQEFSQRYSDVSSLPKLLLPRIRRQDVKNKQASHDDLEQELILNFHKKIEKAYGDLLSTYDDMLSCGVAKECARSILPLGTPTRLYMSGTIRSFIHYVEIRAAIETQLEHRMIAQDIKGIMKQQMPSICSALEWV